MRDLQVVKDFREDFYSLVSQIPSGRVSTYGSLAKALGDKIAARAVGKMLNQNPYAPEVPCHRVVRSDGTLGGYAKGKEKKKELLEKEGIDINEENMSNFKDIIFSDFESDYPLKELRRIQLDVKKKISLESASKNGDRIAGVDVSYSYPNAYAALSLWKDGEVIDLYTDKSKMKFPYIPTYLAFRELPSLLNLLEKVKIEPDIVMVDGNGILHPNRVGLASHLGVETGISTIGVAKSKLCGTLAENVNQKNRVSEVRKDGKSMGHAVLEGDRAKNPIYVSPGHHVSHNQAVEIVREYCEYKVPEPIRKAHIEA
ncbi:MAG: endonuclease V, partial [Candidatus Thermoplasmatota archaeon]